MGGKAMGKILSPAGDFAFQIDTLERQGNELVVTGIMGIWESRIHFSAEELAYLFAKAVSTPRIVMLILTLPIILVKRRLARKQK